jgi:hypothetical protein
MKINLAKTLMITILTCSLLYVCGCASEPETPTPFEPKGEAPAPWGLKDLCKRDPKANC